MPPNKPKPLTSDKLNSEPIFSKILESKDSQALLTTLSWDKVTAAMSLSSSSLSRDSVFTGSESETPPSVRRRVSQEFSNKASSTQEVERSSQHEIAIAIANNYPSPYDKVDFILIREFIYKWS